MQQIDRTTGELTGKKWLLPAEKGDLDTDVNGWAFAHWGGVFYVFSTVHDSSTVFAVHRESGKVEKVLTSRHIIVGAGVSTCAPLLEAK